MLNSLISHVGPLQPGAQVQENSFTTCAGAAFIWDVSGLERASGILPPGLPIVLMPRIPRTALGTIFVSGSVGWRDANLLVFLSYLNLPLSTLTFITQVPPFLQGNGAQGCSTISQRVPDKPSAHVQRYSSGLVFSHVPPCMQGSWVPQ